MRLLLALAYTVAAVAAWTPPTYNATVWKAFRAKTLLNPPPPLTYNPYDNVTNTTWPDSVCAVKYPDPSNRSTYMLHTYASRAAAEADGAFVTHEHPCGYCSTTKDLSVYMEFGDLTNPVRDCALIGFASQQLAIECLSKVGFTPECSKIWLYDADNTRKDCFDICIKDWWNHVPNNIPPNSTNLNPCLECDEVKSGPIFKLFAGRTRRDSGLKSAINRPASAIYEVTHYYY